MEKKSTRELISELVRSYSETSSVPGGVAVYRLKNDGRVETQFVSASFAKLLGYENTEELMGRIRVNMLNEVPPEDWDYFMFHLNNGIKSQSSISLSYNIFSKARKRKKIRLNANIMTEAQMRPDDVAVIYAVHTLVYDEATTEESKQERYHAIFDMLGIVYWDWSADNGFYCSEKCENYAVCGIGPQTNWNPLESSAYVHPDDGRSLEEYYRMTGPGGKKKSLVIRAKMKDGSYRWTEIISLTDFDSNGGLHRIISVMRDVDAEWMEYKKRLDEPVIGDERDEKARSDFLARVSRDMRTPLNGILGLIALLKENVDDEKAQQDLQQLQISGQYLLSLFNDSMDVSKIESGNMELHPVICDNRTLFNNAIASLRPNIDAKNIRLNVQSNTLEDVTLFADVDRIEQIVMNILDNAIKFTPDGGFIDFFVTNLSATNNVITSEIVIRDTGIGMSREFLPHLFEPFTQENTGASANSVPGTGLGMTITKQLVELMGGDIRVESEVGKGSKFTITIPLKIATEEEISSSKDAAVSEKNEINLKGRRVLLCEDHPMNANITSRLLTGKGIIVEQAANGSIGVTMFQQSGNRYYDAILMDIRMPVMDGLEATRTIRALTREDAKNVPIIAMTANALAEDIQETKAAGMDAHLVKPIEPQKLFDTLEKTLNMKNAYRRPTVLVVDDIARNRLVIKKTLMHCYTILEAENGKRALEILSKTKTVDAVITDIQMPVMDGTELIKRIRANPELRHLAIIANTQFGEPRQEEKLLALGANDIIFRPTTPRTIEIRVHNVLRNVE